MALQSINVGSRPNDGTGDTVRNAFVKTNENFAELYAKYDELINLNVPTFDEWQRPSDWKVLDIPSDNQQKFIALYAVRNNPYNYCAFTVSGNYTVNWGDGSPLENYSSGTKAEHQYNFNDADLADSLTSEGYKQAIITVTPQNGSNLTSINLGVKHSFYNGKSVVVEAGYLDFVLVGQYLTTFKVTQTADLTPITATTSSYLNSGEVIYSLPYQYDNGSSSVNTEVSFNLLHQFYIGKNALTTISENFQYCVNLRRIERLDLSNCFAMQTFEGCAKLETVKNLKIVSSQSVFGMFYYCSGLKYLHAEKIYARDCDWMFYYCSSLKYVKIDDFSGSVFCNRTFYQCVSLNRVSISKASEVLSFEQAFEGCNSLLTAVITNTDSLVNIGEMFDNCRSLIKVKFTDTPSLIAANLTFNNCASLKEVLGLNFKYLKEMESIFQYCYSLETFEFNSENNVYPISATTSFYECLSLRNVTISSNTTFSGIVGIFEKCSSLESAPIIKMPNDSYGAFAESGIKIIDNINTSNVITATSLFSDCFDLTNVGNLNLDLSQNVDYMFLNCYNLIEVGIINLANVTSASLLFYDCRNLTRSQVKNLKASHSYQNCYNLTGTALNEIFTNLGTPVSTRTINLTNVLGTTDPEFNPSIATEKNWTVTY